MDLPLFPEALAAEFLEVEAHYEGPSQESGAPIKVDVAAGGGSSDSGSDDDEAELNLVMYRLAHEIEIAGSPQVQR